MSKSSKGRLRFRDPYGKTTLSARKTLLFCAYNRFVIPHDIVGAILYGEALSGVDEVFFGQDVMEEFTPSLNSFVPDVDWCLAAIKDMGYQDIVDEFNVKSEEVSRFVEEKFVKYPYDIELVKDKVISVIPDQYRTYLNSVINK